MKNIYLIIAFLLGTTYYSFSQCSGDIYLSSQTQIDNFSCTQIFGHLIISDDNDGIDNIVSLEGLYTGGLNTDSSFITGAILIEYCNSLVNLNGLEGIHSCQGINIHDNPELKYMTDKPLIFKNIGGLRLRANNKLETIDKFNHIDTISVLSIIENPSLQQLDESFTNLKIIKTLNIITNNELISIPSFPVLEQATYISIGFNDKLAKIDAFHNPKVYVDELYISNNNILESINGFNLVSEIRILTIRTNPILTKINCFQELKKCQEFRIDFNDILETINITHVIEPFTYEGSILHFRANKKILDCCWIKPFFENYASSQILGNSAQCALQLEDDYNCTTETTIADENDFQIYPNPTSDFITLDYIGRKNDLSNITFINIHGDSFVPSFSELHDHKYLIDIGHLAPAYYVVVITDNKGKHTYASVMKI